jgi:phage tail-like protein
MLGMSMRFTVTVDALTDLGNWSKASGLEVSWDLVEYRAGDAKNDRWIFPGLTKYPTVKLERAAEKAASAKVQTYLNSNSFKYKEQTAKIVLQDASGTEVLSWTLQRAMPVKWSIVAFDGSGNKVATETLELAHTGFLSEE